MTENVDHPAHYGGEGNPYECIAVIEAWGLGFHLGNAVKYIARAGLKNPDTEGEDLDKAIWYLQRYLELEFARLKQETVEILDDPAEGETEVAAQVRDAEGARLRDAEGDIWVKQLDDTWTWIDADSDSVFRNWSFDRLMDRYGPLMVVE